MVVFRTSKLGLSIVSVDVPPSRIAADQSPPVAVLDSTEEMIMTDVEDTAVCK
jgi:hypothetical protein